MPATKSSVKAGHLFQDIDDLFKDYKRPARHLAEPFDYLCVVAGRVDSPGPRDPMWEHRLDFGMPKIAKVLKKEPIGAGPHYFIFPDRWLQPGEAVEFESLLAANPDAKKFGRIYIVTNQPYLVSSCMAEQCRILRKA